MRILKSAGGFAPSIMPIKTVKSLIICAAVLAFIGLGACVSDDVLVKTELDLAGKYISVLGDSISTYDVYSNGCVNGNSTLGNNAVYYPLSYGGMTIDDTWWMQLIARANAILLVNNSWSGSTVTGGVISSGNGARAKNLHCDIGNNAGRTLDIIIVYLGINDFDAGISIEQFSAEYCGMIGEMSEAYPEAQIYCLNLPYRAGADSERLTEFNNSISVGCERYDCRLVDVYANTWTQINYERYLIDGLHPNSLGMDLITNELIHAFDQKVG